jgi:hAT family C-terminal dimerisation region
LDEPTSSAIEPPRKRPRLYTARDSYVKANTGTAEGRADDDEYETWKKIKPLNEGHPLAQDPIKYWWQLQTEYLRLSRIALDILTIPVASTNCERGFSECGNLLEKRRSRLLPTMITALSCNRSWKKIGFKKAAAVPTTPRGSTPRQDPNIQALQAATNIQASAQATIEAASQAAPASRARAASQARASSRAASQASSRGFRAASQNSSQASSRGSSRITPATPQSSGQKGRPGGQLVLR